MYKRGCLMGLLVTANVMLWTLTIVLFGWKNFINVTTISVIAVCTLAIIIDRKEK